MFIDKIDPVLFHLGPLEIRYYGVLYALSFVLAFFILRYLAKKRHIEFTTDDILDLLIYIAIGTVVGARIFYILFYNLSYYVANPKMIFAIWQGGLSFHGGLVGVLIAVYIYSKRRKIPMLKIADLLVVPAALGLFLGRIGNFLNSELYGRETTVPWAVNFNGELNANGDQVWRHPSQLYEAAKNLFIFFTLWVLAKKEKLKDGTMFFTFVLMYSILRFVIEFYREPDPQIGFLFLHLTMGQLLNIAMFIISLGVLLYITFKKTDKNDKKTQDKRYKKRD